MRKMADSSKVDSRIRLRLCAEAKISTERLFDDDARIGGAARFGQLFHDQSEQHGRDGEIVRRSLRRAQLLADGLKRGRIVVVAVNIPQQAGSAGRTPPHRAPRGARGYRAPGP